MLFVQIFKFHKIPQIISDNKSLLLFMFDVCLQKTIAGMNKEQARYFVLATFAACFVSTQSIAHRNPFVCNC